MAMDIGKRAQSTVRAIIVGAVVNALAPKHGSAIWRRVLRALLGG